ncbi:MAG: NTP transferase domain-containing protein [Desulfovibrionaceae bacterium]|jgi:spore coat polysaccharide biosynthesis protein SpsF|nr:NTP transferase domain-containing protein [Desulfovibrionaceae bacterium]
MPGRYVVFVQARASSTRLPGKVLMDIHGKPMLLRQLQRLAHGLAQEPDGPDGEGPEGPVVVTSTDPSDDPVAALCADHGFGCCRGSLHDVLARYVDCCAATGATHVIRVGGDDPLIDPACCIALMRAHQAAPHDFLYAAHRAGWPYGAAAELISADALRREQAATRDPLHLEHIVPFFHARPAGFTVQGIAAPAGVHRPDYAFTVDHPEDMELVRTIFGRLLPTEGEFFSLRRVIELVDAEPGIRDVNRHLHTGFDF